MNNNYVSEITSRYVYQVTKRLPVAQRGDIEKELNGLIEDMLAERTDTPEANDIDTVLIELGKPEALADKYRDSKRYLIGPTFFDTYTLVLKIVLAATAFGMMIAMLIKGAIAPPDDLLKFSINFFASIITALFQAFCWVTVVFAIAERYNSKVELKPDVKWRPSDLPEVPQKKAIISRWQSMIGIAFSVFIIILFNFAPNLISVYISLEDTVIINIFNLDTLRTLLPLFNTIFCLGIAKELFKLITGKYTLKLSIGIIGLNVVILFITVIIFTNPGIWNPDMISTLSAIKGFTPSELPDLGLYWSFLKKFFIVFLLIVYIIETLDILYRSLKYRA